MDEKLDFLFGELENVTNSDTDQSDSFESKLKSKIFGKGGKEIIPSRPLQLLYVEKLIDTVQQLSSLISDDRTVLVSVKNQKVLRCCFQIITSLGLLPSLIPGVGIAINKRSEKAVLLPAVNLDDTVKYEILKQCTDFFINSYNVPVLKNIILTSHLADYLAGLLQLCYAPLKKPGVYESFTMTQEMYDKFLVDRSKYIPILNNLVSTCFQPMIMKELMVLQCASNPSPPAFLKRVTSRELSKRLLAPGGLLSLIRCFIEAQNIDAGQEWKKVEMIKKIIGENHGLPEDVYIRNISLQLKDIISSSNVHYYSTAAVCISHLREKYPNNKDLNLISDDILKCFDVECLNKKCCAPGSIVLTSQEVQHKINILHAFFCEMHLNNESAGLLSSNLYILFLIRLKCTKFYQIHEKLDSLIFKHLEGNDAIERSHSIKELLFGKLNSIQFSIEEYDSGIVIKGVSKPLEHPLQEAFKYFTEKLTRISNSKLAGITFEICLEQLLAVTEKRTVRGNKSLMELEDKPDLVDNLDATYAVTLQILEELSAVPNVMSSIIKNPECVLKFIEGELKNPQLDKSDECVTIALVLLNTLLSETTNSDLKNRCTGLIPILHKLSADKSEISLLSDEILKIVTGDRTSDSTRKSQFESVVSDVFDNLLPVRAHGLIELTKLIERKDPEAISKKHYVLCLFQEHLKDEDSYVYLAAVNGIAALGRHCTEDVLNVLCKEYLEYSVASADMETVEMSEKRAQLRMKVGDVIVKVTRGLGEMTSVHKTILINTVLCACRDNDPLVRASALSNLAELARVLHYRLGTVLHEVLLCICGVIESDKSPECRRAAVMVVSSLLRGLGRETLTQMQDVLLATYRTLKGLYSNTEEDAVVRLHAQIALEELNDIVKDFLNPKIDLEKKFIISENKMDINFK